MAALAKLNIHWTKRQTLGIRRTVMQEKIISRPDQSGTNSCAAIIVAAGSARAASTSKFTARQDSPFGHDNFEPNDLPKQFWQLGDKPVIAHSFDYFHHHPAIAAIILVVAEPYIPHMADILPETQKPYSSCRWRCHAAGFGSRWFDRPCWPEKLPKYRLCCHS